VLVSLTALKTGDRVLGVRAGMSDGVKYDIPYDVYRGLGLDPTLLPVTQMWLRGGKWVSKEEMDSGLPIQEIGTKSGIIKEVVKSKLNTGVDVVKIVSMEDKERLLKWKNDLRAKYFYALYGVHIGKPIDFNINPAIKPDWLDNVVEHHIQTSSTGLNYFSVFGKKQREALKEYSKWRSCTIFNSMVGDKVFTVNSESKTSRDIFSGGVGVWRYGGMVESLSLGGHGNTCDHGHKLKYVHYAVNMSIKSVVSFGVECISDFFVVDNSVVDVLSKIQECVTSETRLMSFVTQTGKLDACIDGYSDYHDVMKDCVHDPQKRWLDLMVNNKLPLLGYLWGLFEHRNYVHKNHSFLLK